VHCLHWAFIPGTRDTDPCYQLFIQDTKGKLKNAGMVIQDASAVTNDPESFVVYRPVKSVIVGQRSLQAVDKTNSLYRATVIAVALATRKAK
jgi:hypothetical protein